MPFLCRRLVLVISAACLPSACCLAQALSEAQQEHPLSNAVTARYEVPSQPSASQQQSPQETSPDSAQDKKKQKHKKPHRGSWVLAPLPISSPAIGSGITPIVAYIFPLNPKDKISPPSTIFAGGIYTSNGSRGFAFGAALNMKEDTYRIKVAAADGTLNYNVYGTGVISGQKLPLEQQGKGFFASISRGIGHGIFIGPRATVGNSVISLQPTGEVEVPTPPDLGLHTNLISVGAQLERDTTVGNFYPTAGDYLKITSDFYSQGLGSKFSFQSYAATFNKFWSLSQSQVLAYNGYFCATTGSPPFYGNCIYGTKSELRGYTSGQYFPAYMVATQLEYRRVLPWRLGFVVFGGLGGTIPGESQIYSDGKFLPAGGGGLRLQLSKAYHVNLRADLAEGRNGHTFGIGVGEAF